MTFTRLLKVIGKMNGTLLEAMITNGTISSEAEVVDPALVSEIHQAMDEQSKEFDQVATSVLGALPI